MYLILNEGYHRLLTIHQTDMNKLAFCACFYTKVGASLNSANCYPLFVLCIKLYLYCLCCLYSKDAELNFLYFIHSLVFFIQEYFISLEFSHDCLKLVKLIHLNLVDANTFSIGLDNS